MSNMRGAVPNAIIAGVIKGGTTSLYSYLTRHPDICGASIKETCYFHGFKYGACVESIDVYSRYFSHCGKEKIRLEATAGYFDGGVAVASGIKNTLGSDIKIFLLLRDPVERFVSYYRFAKSMLWIPNDMSFRNYFESCLGLTPSDRRIQDNSVYCALEVGKYDQHLKPWLDCFPGSIRIYFFDDLKRDALGVTWDACEWLGVSTSELTKASLSVENKTVAYRFEALQRVALAINKEGEQFWRKHPKIKSHFRRAYQRLNGGQWNNDISEEVMLDLKSFYAPNIEETRKILTMQGCSTLPGWLTHFNLPSV